MTINISSQLEQKNSTFNDERLAENNVIEKLVLPTQLPSDSDDSHYEEINKNHLCIHDYKAPVMTCSSVLKNEWMWGCFCFDNVNFVLMRQSAIISFGSLKRSVMKDGHLSVVSLVFCFGNNVAKWIGLPKTCLSMIF